MRDLRTLLILGLILIFGTLVTSTKGNTEQKGGKKQKNDSVAVAKLVIRKKKSFDDSLKVYKRYPGLFKFYQDSTNGNVLMSIKKDQLDKEYVYFSYSENGPVSVGSFKGNYRDNKVFTIKKHFNKIEFVSVNTNFYFDPANALSKSADANISNAVLLSQKIMDTDIEKGEYLINADEIFLSEILHRIKPQAPKGVPADAFFSLGSLSRSKSKFLKIRNYPQNTDLLIEYVFENQYPSAGGGAEVTDDRNVSIQIQHSFIQLPQDGYKPRFDDPRVGYFLTYVNDMTSTGTTPYRDMIHRWHLKKKDSTATLSVPIVPIVWWIEKTTPQGYRASIKGAALAWNQAFEKAGFKNAIEIYEQPDTATWDAGDIRYNVLRWTSSPSPIFGGFGPSFVNPKTGQILGADVMLEFVFMTNKLRQEKLFDIAGLHQFENHFGAHENCFLTDYLQQSVMFGRMALNTIQQDKAKTEEYEKQAIYYLVLHELGHTLGLNHNMKASQMLSPAQMNDKKITSKLGLTASVMDYPTVNIAEDPKNQGDYFTYKPGPYDEWAIEYGYKTFADSISEVKGLQKILSRSIEPALAFGNDADDMRAPGMHIDPRVMINDQSNDAISYMSQRIKIASNLSKGLLKKHVQSGESYHELRNAYLMLTSEYANAASVISRYVGGVYVDRSMAGQQNTLKPYTPVSIADQKRAFNAISRYIFSPTAMQSNNELYQYLQMQRRGFGMMGQNEDPKIHDRVLSIQKNVLDHWLHPNVLKRMTDTKLYGNDYELADFMNDLTSAICSADIASSPNSFRKNLQTEYVSRLASATKSDMPVYDHMAKAAIHYQLKKIQKMIMASHANDESTRAHHQYLLLLIQKGLAVK